MAEVQDVGPVPVVLYEFGEGSGSVVGDSSGVGVPLDLSVADPGAVSWSAGGLSVDVGDGDFVGWAGDEGV